MFVIMSVEVLHPLSSFARKNVVMMITWDFCSEKSNHRKLPTVLMRLYHFLQFLQTDASLQTIIYSFPISFDSV